MSEKDKADLEAFVKRGGGIVSFHDSLCAADPEYWANTYTGGAKKHGETNFSQGDLNYTITDKNDPIMAGMSDFTMNEESFMLMTWAKTPIHPLATVKIPGGAHAGEVVPQIWTYEHTAPGGTAPSRAFIWMQGHYYKNFVDPKIEPMILRGIAWAGKKPIDTLMNVVAQPNRGRGIGGSDIQVPEGRGR
jgi:type 1 glutamine amidotransferase